jgi:polysaccharide biosynthesis/export protein
MSTLFMRAALPALCLIACATLTGCSSNTLPVSKLHDVALDAEGNYQYRIGSGDVISVFVWRNAELSGDYVVRPDGKISMALSQAVIAAGKTSEELADVITESLSVFIKKPKVTVMLKQFVGSANEQIRIVGEATKPFAVPYTHGVTLLDLMIKIGGLSTYADGNDAILVRIENGRTVEYPLAIEDLLIDADLNANVDLKPGDVIRIPEAWF